MAITDFLKTARSRDDLKIALEVLREFKNGESREEYLSVMFAAWTKLEQYQEFLEYLVEGAALQDDTMEYINKQERGELSR